MEGKYYLPLTTIFLHADVFHLLYNMIALALIGSTIEKKISRKFYLLIYLLSGYISSLSILIYKENIYGLGASGAISGLIGFGSIRFPTTITLSPIGVIIPLPFIIVGAVYLLINFFGLFIPSQIGFLAHLAGFLIGFFIGLAVSQKKILRIFGFSILLLFLYALLYFLFQTFQS